MNTTVISATELKRGVSDILNRVHYERITAIIKRHDEAIAKIVPMEDKDKNSDISSLLSKYFGILPHFPEVTKKRSKVLRKIAL